MTADFVGMTILTNFEIFYRNNPASGNRRDKREHVITNTHDSKNRTHEQRKLRKIK